MGTREHPDPLLLQTVSARLARLLEEAAPPAEVASDTTATAATVAPERTAPLPAGTPLEVEDLQARPRFRRVHVGVVAAVLLAGLLWSGWSLLRARPIALTTASAGPLATPVAPAGSPAPAAPVSDARPPSPSSPAAPAPPGQDAGGAGTPAGESMGTEEVVVHVLGAVRSPGLVSLRGQARVQDAVDAAGGFTRRADPGELNLAQVLQDGQQVVIGTAKRPDGQVRGGAGATVGAGGGPRGSPAASASGVVDLNRADATQLEGLPGVGPVTAGAILAWRTEHGRFRSIDELQEVDGIGPKTFAQIAPHVRV